MRIIPRAPWPRRRPPPDRAPVTLTRAQRRAERSTRRGRWDADTDERTDLHPEGEDDEG